MEDLSSEHVLTLPAVLDLNNAAGLKTSLRDRFEKDDAIVIDCSEVTRITTPAVQILLSLGKSIGPEGPTPVFLRPSEAFCSAFRDLGLQDQLSSWSTT